MSLYNFMPKINKYQLLTVRAKFLEVGMKGFKSREKEPYL